MNVVKSRPTPTGLLHEYSPVMAEKIYTPEDSAKNGVITSRYRVQLRQVVRATYPAARGNALFSREEFGGKDQIFLENRVCFLNVPKEVTLQMIQQKLDEMDGPTLVRTLSLKPRLSEDQMRTIEQGRNPKSYEEYLNDFIPDQNDNPVLYRGQKQYRKVDFSKSWADDIDLRAEDYQVEFGGKGIQMSQPAGSTVPSRI